MVNVEKLGVFEEDIYEISKMQKGLDDVVLERFTELKERSNVVWKINALIVEMGECLQEWKGFKKWKKDQTPNYVEMKEEYVDWFHFVISVGLEFGYDFKSKVCSNPYEKAIKMVKGKDEEEELDILNEYILEWNMLFYGSIVKGEDGNFTMESNNYQEVLIKFIVIGYLLGFSWEDILEGYYAKNKVNHKRQENGY